MFSLILTLAGIALVVALALATLYYGSSSSRSATASATASRVILQGQQLLGASELYKVEVGAWPASVGHLATTKYLKTIPSVQAVTGSTGTTPGQWQMPKTGNPLYLLEGAVSSEACALVNLKGSLKRKGILKQAYPSLKVQCYGATEADLKVVVNGITGPDALDGLTPGDIVAPGTGVPTDPLAPGWLQPPGEVGPVPPGPVDPPVPDGSGLQFSVNLKDFGGIAILRSASAVVKLYNTSNQSIAFQSFNYSDDHFYVDDSACMDDSGSEGVLPPKGACDVVLEFYPTAEGPLSAMIYAHDKAGAATLKLLGVGLPKPAAKFSVSSDLVLTALRPSWELDGTGALRGTDGFFTVTNTGAQNLRYADNYNSMWIPQIVGDVYNPYEKLLLQDDSCAGAMLAPGETCRVKITFFAANSGMPDTTGTAPLRFYDEEGTLREVSRAVTAHTPAVSQLSSYNLKFPAAGGSIAVTATNLADYPLTGDGSSPILKYITGSSSFRLVNNGDNCDRLAARATCTFVLQYSPAFGPYSPGSLQWRARDAENSTSGANFQVISLSVE